MAQNSNEDDEDPSFYDCSCILSVAWHKGTLACAYYKLETFELFATYECLDMAPDFSRLNNIQRHIRPKYFLASGPNHFLRYVMNLCKLPKYTEPGNFRFGKKTTPIMSNFLSFPRDESSLHAARQKILNIKLPGMTDDFSLEEKHYFLESVLPLQQELVVHSLGNLLIYLEANWRQIFHQNNTSPIITDATVFLLESQLLLDPATISSLQIFAHNVQHPSSYKVGVSTAVKEGCSVYNLFNNCFSKIGNNMLKTLLSQPTRDIDELNKSYDTIEWCLLRQNKRELLSFRKYLHNLGDISANFRNIILKPNSSRNWDTLKRTLLNGLLIVNLCQEIAKTPAGIENTIISDLAQCSEELAVLDTILDVVNYVVDFNLTREMGRFVVNNDVDVELDEKKSQMFEIHQRMQEIIDEESMRFPHYFNESLAYYIPELGFVIKTTLLDGTDGSVVTQEMLEEHKLKMVCHVGSDYYFSSDLCDEQNSTFGQIYPQIVEHECRIRQRLIEEVRQNLGEIQHIMKLCARLDCLMSLATIAEIRSLVRPVFVAEKSIEIKNGWHILWDTKKQFVTNDSGISSEKKNLITILSAPNASGKSVYLKQVALIAYLAHVGSFVPASSARLCLLDSIYSRIHIPESTYIGSSSFLTDLQQMGRMMTSLTGHSLVLIDEFGNGTNVQEGQALLASCIENLSARGSEGCPITLVSTHYAGVYDLLRIKDFISLQTIDNVFMTDGALKSTFKLKPGKTRERYASQVLGVKEFLDSLGTSMSSLHESSEDITSVDYYKNRKREFAFIAFKRFMLNGPSEIDHWKEMFSNFRTYDPLSQNTT